MKSEIIKELEENVIKMELLILKQKFCVGDAEDFLGRYFNILRKMEDLEKSRDNWKNQYNTLKEIMEKRK